MSSSTTSAGVGRSGSTEWAEGSDIFVQWITGEGKRAINLDDCSQASARAAVFDVVRSHMAEPTFDLETAHTWFAKSLNNTTWDWLDANGASLGTPRSGVDPVMHQAHASYHHWRQVGTVINQARAASLVANVHATLGNGELARALALECLELMQAAGEETQDWDWAFGHDSLARAMTACGDADAAMQWGVAQRLGSEIADPDDKQVFDAWFAQRPTEASE